MRINAEDIFTPQGRLEEVERNPNLDFLMNLFNIPRAFGVSGFGGNWDVGKHSFATALIALFWSRFNQFCPEKRDRLVTLALVHDLHEAVTGDILPMFKTKQIRVRLNQLQANILRALAITEDETLRADLKVVDMVAFLYEIRQVSPSILHSKKLALANTIASRQRDILIAYCESHRIAKKKIMQFLTLLDLV
ncbi:MAG: HD domain-containing protein [bacterium]|nr:HD domain-containing protein [bacterium]MDZ4296095.1 HD domain-containing protein [Patescibacteria group bacterium]